MSCVDKDKIPCIIQTRAEPEDRLYPLVTIHKSYVKIWFSYTFNFKSSFSIGNCITNIKLQLVFME